MANVANCNTWLFLPSVPSFLPLDSFSALTYLFAFTSCMWISCVSATVFEVFSSLPPTEVRMRVANLISPAPCETTVLKVVWVKESEEIGCDSGTVKKYVTGEHQSWGRCRRTWGRGWCGRGIQEYAGRTDPLSALFSACASSSRVVSSPFSLRARGDISNSGRTILFDLSA